MSEMAVSMVKDNSLLKDLDRLLRCGICYEYMKTTMITDCSHNYCSLCIRKSLMYKPRCPACFEEIFNYQLRNNKIVDELIQIFQHLMELLHNQPKNNFPQTYTNETRKEQNLLDIRESNKVCNKEMLRHVHEPTTSQIKVRETKGLSSDDSDSNDGYIKNISSQQEIQSTSKVERQIPSMFTPKKTNSFKHNAILEVNLVACPVCNVDIPDKNINTHLDACLKRSETMQQKRSSKHVEKRKPLPKLVYSLLGDKELKKKLKEPGLSTQGDRQVLISRHQRYTLLYNSECDSSNPRSSAEIVQQVEREEKEEKKASSVSISNMLKIDRKTDPKLIEQAQQQYLQQNKKSFDDLIKAIKKRESAKKTSFKPNRIESDVEEENISEAQNSKVNVQDKEMNYRKLAVKDRINDDDDDDELIDVPDMCDNEKQTDDFNNESGIENMDETPFDLTCESDTDKVTSPVFGRHVGAVQPRRENEKDDKSTPDMFLTQHVYQDVSSEDDSISILSQITPDVIINAEASTSKSSEPDRKQSDKEVDSQIADPDFVPDEGDVSQDFNIKRQPSRSKRKVNRSSSSIGEGRALRKRSKH